MMSEVVVATTGVILVFEVVQWSVMSHVHLDIDSKKSVA